MTGSLQIKNGKYQMVLNLYVDGKRKVKWISTGLEVRGNKRKAEEMLRNLLQNYEPEKLDANIPFTQCVYRWLEKVKGNVDDITYQGYEVQARCYVLPYFKEKGFALKDITTEVLQAFFDEKYKRGRKDGKGGLSPSTLCRIRNVIKQTLDEMKKEKWISTNPCCEVKLPKQERYESHFYTASQLKILFSVIEEDPLCEVIHIATLYGLRRSEVLGIKWDSINYDLGLLTIKHTVAKVTKVISKDKTKTSSSYRSFPLTGESIAIFHLLKKREEENRRLMGSEYQENEYVFKWPTGRPYSPDYVSHRFQRILKKYHLPHIRFHELRHSCASLLLKEKFTLQNVKDWMGHADIKMTANIYGHLDVAYKKGMADVLNGIL